MPTKSRGFANMDPTKQKEIAAMGGKAAHASGYAHQWTRQQAQEAARKSREVRRAKKAGTYQS